MHTFPGCLRGPTQATLGKFYRGCRAEPLSGKWAKSGIPSASSDVPVRMFPLSAPPSLPFRAGLSPPVRCVGGQGRGAEGLCE